MSRNFSYSGEKKPTHKKQARTTVWSVRRTLEIKGASKEEAGDRDMGMDKGRHGARESNRKP